MAVIKILLESIKSLLIEMHLKGELLATGTSFVVHSKVGPLLITNRHNVSGVNEQGELLSKSGKIPNELKVYHNKKGKLGDWIYKWEPLYHEGNPLWIEHPVLGNKVDFVALKLTQLDDIDIYPYSLEQPENPLNFAPSDGLSIIGFPFSKTGGGCLGIWSTGFLATESDINLDNLPKFLIDSRTRQGQSGSPVIIHKNGGTIVYKDGSSAIINGTVTEFLGIYSGRINKESDLGIVWKASAIKELVDSIN